MFWQQFRVTFLITVTRILFLYCQRTNVNNKLRKNGTKNTLKVTNKTSNEITIQFVYKKTHESRD